MNKNSIEEVYEIVKNIPPQTQEGRGNCFLYDYIQMFPCQHNKEIWREAAKKLLNVCEKRR